MSESDVTKMKVADLKRELKVRGLATTGNKTELQDRLQNALLDGDISLEDSAITNEDALLDEDAVLTDEEESPIAADENELLKSPTTTPTASELASPDTDNNKADGVEGANATATPKKIILKRKSSYSSDGGEVKSVAVTAEGAAPSTTATIKENADPPKEKILKMSERHPITTIDLTSKKKTNITAKSVIDLTSNEQTKKANNGTITGPSDANGGTKKVVQLSQMERLELRAKKFGLNSNAKAAATTAAIPAAAPPVTTTTTPIVIKPKGIARISTDSGSIINDPKQIEMLKKRAERFGCVVSSKMAQIDAAERLQKRKERFGAGGNSTTAGAKDNDVWAEKARARLERFKNTPTIPSTTSDNNKVIAKNSSSAESVEVVDDAKNKAAPINSTPSAPSTAPVASN